MGFIVGRIKAKLEDVYGEEASEDRYRFSWMGGCVITFRNLTD